MKLYDISMPIHENMMVYKNLEEKRPRISLVKKIPEDTSNESSVTMNVHTGTHIDAPFHMDSDGNTMDQLDITRLLTVVRVLDLTAVQDKIIGEDLTAHQILKNEFILLKTSNSFTEEFSAEFIYVAQSGAEYLALQGISGVGIDGLGIERAQPNHESHKVLMHNGIIIMEGLRLKEVPAGTYFMCALPLRIQGVDGSPARAVLIEMNSEKSSNLFESMEELYE